MSLILEIVRHGEAAASHPDGDAARPLTPRGIARLRMLAATLASSGWHPDRILASPYLRAQQTAQILAEACGSPVETAAALEPDTSPHEILDALHAEGVEAGHLVLVSHLPLVERLQAALADSTAPWTPGTLVRIALPEGLAGRGTVAEVRTP